MPATAVLCFGLPVDTETLLSAAFAFKSFQKVADAFAVLRNRAASNQLKYRKAPGAVHAQRLGLGNLSKEVHDVILDHLAPLVVAGVGAPVLEERIRCPHALESALYALEESGLDPEDEEVRMEMEEMEAEYAGDCDCREGLYKKVCSDKAVQEALARFLGAHGFALAAPLATDEGINGVFETSYIAVLSWTRQIDEKEPGSHDGRVNFGGQGRTWVASAGSHSLTGNNGPFSAITMDNELLHHIVTTNAKGRMIALVRRFRIRAINPKKRYETSLNKPKQLKAGSDEWMRQWDRERMVAEPCLMSLVMTQ